ncbi:MAG: MetQ/NlpA family ABC transporter substrate-binding protein [Atopostipes suicloacalis]|nr:MetQ/NlpA family ABC transporter substrate-binding protein [Atopostipes suicloacalis]MDN6730641.1 MetQ/NlpA family ABC transporter substrate-binding protein [Atopostipes suicloacalis]
MKKRFITTMAVLAIFLVACGGNTNENEESANQENNEQTLKVAAIESPMTDVVEIAQELLAKEDITLELVQMGDYIQPNEALVNNEIDATFSQHVPFMEQFNQNTDANLAEVQSVYYANFGLYSREYDQIEDLPEDISIGIANDPSNVDRSLRLLASHDLIELNEIDDDQYSLEDIKEDSHNYSFEDAEISALARLYDDVDSVIMNPTHASHLDLTPADDALITEKEDNRFAITLVTREDNADSDLIQKLAEAMTSEEVREFLNNREGGASIPTF